MSPKRAPGLVLILDVHIAHPILIVSVDINVQQDGATCQTANETMTLLRRTFNGSIISRNGDHVISHCWTTILWLDLKEVYTNKLSTIQEQSLKEDTLMQSSRNMIVINLITY